MLLSELVKGQNILACGGRQDTPVLGIAYDSRRVGPGFLFVAIEGFQTDGHRFIEQAVAAGAAAVVVQKPVAVPAFAAWVQVADSRLALGLLAARFYGYPARQLKMAGVTGTNGKTTTTHLLTAVGHAAGMKVGLIGTIANRIGDRVLPVEHTTPESLDLQRLLAEMAAEKVALAVMEVSSHALALNRVAGCDFDLGIFTNITQDHLDFHQDMDHYLAAKSRLFTSLDGADGERPGTAVINRDDPRAEQLIKATRATVITYGIHGPAGVRAEKIQVTPRGVRFYVTSPWGEGEVRLKLTGLFNVYNALAALAAGGVLGIPLAVITAALSEVAGVPGRFELVDCGQGFAVVVDYAHTPDGLENVLKTARQITDGRLITVFGCGGDRDRSKRPLMGEIAARLSDLPVLTSDNPRTEDPLRIIAGVEEGLSRVLDADGYRIIPDRREAIFHAIAAAEPGDTVVIAGKGHEDYQIIGTRKYPLDDRQEAARALEQIMRARERNRQV